MKSLTYIVFFGLIPMLSISQENDDLQRSYTFNGNSEEKSISFQVKDNAHQLSFYIEGEVKKGRLKLEIIDPNGKREGGFELESSGKGNKTRVSVGSNKNSNSDSNSNSNSARNSNDRGGKSKISTSGSSSGASTYSKSGSAIGTDSGYSYVQSGNGKGSARGHMNKSLTKPIEGKWSIQIIAVETDGTLEVKITQE